jgi:taurine dioxygenase
MAIQIERLNAAIGAEIRGIELGSVSDGELEALHKALLDHKVLFFRNQHLTIEEHIGFGRKWGELEEHPFAADIPGHPEIVVVESTAERPYAAQNWHSDVTWREAPSLGSILRARVVPAVGGDTCFANAETAYDSLKPQLKEQIDGLTASHDYMRTFGAGVPEEKREEVRAKYPIVHHPVVRTHPETGAKAIYTNRPFVSHIDGIDPAESREILRRLERAVMSPNVQCRFRWEVDSIAMWDNRCTQHFATSDFWPEPRRMERVTIAGDKPF